MFGFDIGTTRCKIATLDRSGNPTIITNARGEQTTPSVVYRNPATGEILVGTDAREQGIIDLAHVTSNFKLKLGTTESVACCPRRDLRRQEPHSVRCRRKAASTVRSNRIRLSISPNRIQHWKPCLTVFRNSSLSSILMSNMSAGSRPRFRERCSNSVLSSRCSTTRMNSIGSCESIFLNVRFYCRSFSR